MDNVQVGNMDGDNNLDCINNTFKPFLPST
jgi:hypothetical protein